MDKDKWQWLKIVAFIISVVFSAYIVFQNWTIQRENDRINHRLDVRDAYFNKGLIDGAKDRESAYFEIRSRYERILKHCAAEKNGCNLPNELSVLPQTRQFESLETVLTRIKE